LGNGSSDKSIYIASLRPWVQTSVPEKKFKKEEKTCSFPHLNDKKDKTKLVPSFAMVYGSGTKIGI
jgi:hypothetical protein